MVRSRKSQETNRREFTTGQLALKEIIEELSFPVDLEEFFPPYTVDIFCRNQWIAVEFDGSGHWKKKDAKRDRYLMEKYNLPVLRLTSFAPKSEVQQKILDFIWKWNDSTEERKQVLWKM